MIASIWKSRAAQCWGSACWPGAKQNSYRANLSLAIHSAWLCYVLFQPEVLLWVYVSKEQTGREWVWRDWCWAISSVGKDPPGSLVIVFTVLFLRVLSWSLLVLNPHAFCTEGAAIEDVFWVHPWPGTEAILSLASEPLASQAWLFRIILPHVDVCAPGLSSHLISNSSVMF